MDNNPIFTTVTLLQSTKSNSYYNKGISIFRQFFTYQILFLNEQET